MQVQMLLTFLKFNSQILGDTDHRIIRSIILLNYMAKICIQLPLMRIWTPSRKVICLRIKIGLHIQGHVETWTNSGCVVCE